MVRAGNARVSNHEGCIRDVSFVLRDGSTSLLTMKEKGSAPLQKGKGKRPHTLHGEDGRCPWTRTTKDAERSQFSNSILWLASGKEPD